MTIFELLEKVNLVFNLLCLIVVGNLLARVLWAFMEIAIHELSVRYDERIENKKKKDRE